MERGVCALVVRSAEQRDRLLLSGNFCTEGHVNRSLLVGVLMASVLFIAATSRSDAPSPQPDLSPPVAEAEPITGEPVTPAPGSESVRHEPFTPYDIGRPESAWSYEQLSPLEQEAADRAAELSDAQQDSEARFARAVREQSQRTFSIRAQRQLGVDELASTGVVP